jgi:hypothetical protein
VSDLTAIRIVDATTWHAVLAEVSAAYMRVIADRRMDSRQSPGKPAAGQPRNEPIVKEQERRRHLRVPLNAPGVIRLANGAETNTDVMEISEGGLRCLFPQAVPLGAAAELRFTLPLATRKDCVVFGRVQHHHQAGESYVLGIEYSRATADVMAAIRTFIQMRQPSK